MNRREWLSRSAAAWAGMGAAAARTPRKLKPGVPARSASRVVGANDRINVGHIGVGGMGTAHLHAFVKQSETDKDIQVVSVSDVYRKRN